MDWSVYFNTYSDACEYYGVDTPEQLAAEAACEEAENYVPCDPLDDEIPF